MYLSRKLQKFVCVMLASLLLVFSGGFGSVLTVAWAANSWSVKKVGANDFYGVAYGNGQYLAVGAGGASLSSDRSNWSTRPLSCANPVGVVYAGMQWVVGCDDGKVFTATDGLNWTPHTSGVSNLAALAYNGSGVVVGVGKNETIIRSTDNGATWTKLPLIGLGYNNLTFVTYEGGQFVAVSDNSDGKSQSIYTSPDGNTWTQRSSPTSDPLYSVTYAGNQFVAVGGAGVILTSSNGVTWTKQSSGINSDLYGVAYGVGKLKAVGDAGMILTSTDGISWASETSGTNEVFEKITYGGGYFVAVGYSGTVDTLLAFSQNANLSNLTLIQGTLSPSFAAATTSYTDSVPYAVTSVNVTPTLADSTATVQINGNAAASGSPSSVPLSVGENPIKVLVTAQDGTTTNTYTVTVTRAAASSNASLSNLTVSQGTLMPVFDAGTTSYSADVPNSASSIDVTPTLADRTASVTINGQAVTSGSASSVKLNVGSNTITIVVTAQDGTTTNTYTFTVSRSASSNADLSGLTLNAGTLTPSFASGTTSYNASVPYAVSSLSVTPTVSESTSTVTVNGSAAASGSASSVNLNVGSNTVTIVVTAQDGTTTKTYTLTVTRAASSNADLSDLTLNAGTLTPTFDSRTTSYNSSVPYAVSSLSVTLTVSDSTATVTVNGNAAASGSASSVNLNVGSNTVTILVTAQDGTTKTYRITVTREAASTNAKLSNLTVSQGTLTPVFDSGTTSYSADVPNSASSIEVTPTLADSTASVRINGNAVTSGSASSVSLNVGSNTITIVATAQDGTTTNTYTFTVMRSASSNADLSDLTLNVGTLTPSFASGTTSYSASVPYAVSSLSITPTVSDSTATVTVNGNAAASGSANSVNLGAGSNTVTIVVTAQDGSTKTYTITIERTSPTWSSGGAPDPYAGFIVLIDGLPHLGVAQVTTSYINGRSTMVVALDTSKLDALVGQKGTVVIPVTDSVDCVKTVLNGDAVKLLDNRQATLEVQTPNGNYKLPASKIFIGQVSKQLGNQVKLQDIVINVSISKSNTDTAKIVEASAEKGSYSVVAPPVEFDVTAAYNNQTLKIDKFSSYVVREIPIPDSVESTKVTTAIVLDQDGASHHVPTYGTKRDGKYYAVVHSLTDSTYTLIWHPVAFADVEGHWAQSAVNDMASRMIVNGVDSTHYRPNTAIKRAEFAAIVVRALGLDDSGKTSPFKDVRSGDWYAGAVAKAKEYGIIDGYEDGSYRPVKTITREEAMVILAKAMKAAGMATNTAGIDTNAAAAKFSDSSAVDTWAKAAVALVVQSGIVDGSSEGLLPKKEITRAETAVIFQRMLQKANLIHTPY